MTDVSPEVATTLHVATILARAQTLTADECSALGAAWLTCYRADVRSAARLTAGAVAGREWSAAWTMTRAAWYAAGPSAVYHVRCAIADTVLALGTRDEIDRDVYDALTWAWGLVFGKVHPDDPDRRGTETSPPRSRRSPRAPRRYPDAGGTS
jgi:hypothetical protein